MAKPLSKGNLHARHHLRFAVLVWAFSLSGCAVYEVASTAVDVTTTVVGATVAMWLALVVTAPISPPWPTQPDKKMQEPT